MAETCSICIANYNGEKTLHDCLSSVERQDTCLDMEIIVHDDASTDRSLEIVRGFPGVKLIRSNKNVGFCRSNNRMAKIANGDFFLFLNNDAWLAKDSIQLLYDRSRQNGHKAILGLPQYDASTKQLLDLGYRLDFFLNPIWNKKKDKICYVSGACMWVPRAAWEHVGGFPDFFGSVGEDLYLCLTARLLGYKVGMEYASKFFHHVGQSLGGGNIGHTKGLSTTYRRRFLSERNRLFVMYLTYPLPALAVILPCHLMIILAEGTLLSLLRSDPRCLKQIYLKAVGQFFKSLPSLKGKRRDIQQKRRTGIKTFFNGFIPSYYKIVLLFRYGLPRLK